MPAREFAMKPRGYAQAVPRNSMATRTLRYFGKPRLSNNTACFDNPTNPGLALLSEERAYRLVPVSLLRLRVRVHRSCETDCACVLANAPYVGGRERRASEARVVCTVERGVVHRRTEAFSVGTLAAYVVHLASGDHQA